MKEINWKVRAKNPVFWVRIGASIMVPILSYMGLTIEQITTWEKLGELLLNALSNPFLLGLVMISIMNAIPDPTTKGIGDSKQALEYNKPN